METISSISVARVVAVAGAMSLPVGAAVAVRSTVWGSGVGSVGRFLPRSRHPRHGRHGLPLTVECLFGLGVDAVDLQLQPGGIGKQGLIQFGGEVDAEALGLVVGRGLPRDAHVHGEWHGVPPVSSG